ncbi:MAG TPA: hypothetical protein ENJ75_02745 [Candidatus Kaiserbacteria bacterium]|nr:hypothetical protein [Candidatus Kaiserbacteria bacterium]
MVKKQKEETAKDAVVDEGRNEPHVYELGFHIDPDLSQDDVKTVYQTMKETIASVGTVVATGKPEKIALAYTISRMEHTGRHDFSSAFFSWIAYETTAEGHKKVLEEAESEQRIFRFIDILTTKESAEHTAEEHEMRTKVLDKTSDKPKEENVSEEQLDAALKEVAV